MAWNMQHLADLAVFGCSNNGSSHISNPFGTKNRREYYEANDVVRGFRRYQGAPVVGRCEAPTRKLEGFEGAGVPKKCAIILLISVGSDNSIAREF
eukprot:scaffold16330_cov172-Amphora_coffeaeformis.AAC.16